MANVWNPQTGRWEDPATGNYLVGGQGMPDGTWQGGTWTNPNGGTLGADGRWSDQQTAPMGAPNPQQQQFQAQGQLNSAQQNQITANQGVVNAQQAVVPLSQAQINAQRGQAQAQTGVLQAQAGTFGPQQAVIDAKGNVINQQSAYTQAQQGYIGQEQQANTARIGDANAIVQARGNTADQIAVGQYNQSVADISDRYANAGVSQPVRVATASNQGGPLAPGVIGDVRTQQARVTEAANDRETQRGLQLQGAQLAVQLVGTNVQSAEQAAARVGLTLDQAQLMVQRAENTKGYADVAAQVAGINVNQGNLGVTQARIGAEQAGIGVQQADYNLKTTQMPPFAGAQQIIDPNTGMVTGWGTPAQADQAKTQYQTNLRQQANAQQLRQSGALGNFSQPELLDLIGNGILSDDAVRDELVMRYSQGRPGGLSPYEANLAIENYHRKHGYYDTTGGNSGGGDSDVYGGGSSSTATKAPATLPSATTIGSPTYQRAMEVLQANMAAAGY